MGATGPKLSLLNMLISSLQFVRTVGATNHPLLNSLRRSPPVTASAPSLSALFRTFSYRSLSFSETIGPISTLSRPFPTLIFLVSSTSFSTNSSCIFS